jgi:lysophospholipase L1-like esterase
MENSFIVFRRKPMLKRSAFCMALALALLAGVSCAEDAPKLVLKEGQRVAVVGDSITEQKLYSKNIELYLTACMPQLNLHVIQLGWGGEVAPGFRNRMDNDLMPYKPDVVTTCYGMNDGGYRKYEDGIGNVYKVNMAEIISRLKKAGATVVVGGPGAVDTKFFRPHEPGLAPVYNDNLKHLDTIAKQLAETNGFNHAAVHDSMMSAMEKAKAAFGPEYDVCGRDGVHPGPNGHLVMAYAFLKGMGLDGQLAKITVDMKNGAEASDGHKVLSAANGKVELESTRYPFCFMGDEKSPHGNRSILPYVPFNQELNRFVLVVKNLDGEKANVTWGAETKSFSKAELEKGVNLTEHFFKNPFVEPFNKMDDAITLKENYETTMIKQSINSFMYVARSLDNDKEVVAALDMLKKRFFDKYEKLHETVRAQLHPVKHTIAITPAQ